MRTGQPTRPTLLLAAGLTATACGDLGPGNGAMDPALTTTDSAGVQVVSFDLDALPVVHAVAPEPTWFVGQGAGGDLDLDLFRVVGATHLADGRVAIAEGSTQRVWLVDPASGQVDRLGGEGDGPTEFRGLSSVHPGSRSAAAGATGSGGAAAPGGEPLSAASEAAAPRGTLIVHDARRSRLATFDLAGNLVAEAEVPSMGPPGSTPRVLIDGQGTRYAALVPAMPSGDQMGVQRPDGALVRLGDPPDTLTLLRGREIFHSAVALGIVIFGAGTATAPAHAGVWVGASEEPRIELHSAAGAPDMIVRWSSSHPRQVTEADIDEFWQSLDDAAPGEEPPPSAVMQDFIRFAETHPAFGRVLAAAGAGEPGDLWIGPAENPAADLLRGETLQMPPPEEWVVVRFNEGRAARVTLPPGLRPLAVYDDYLLGIHVDAMGVETVQSHALDWSADAPWAAAPADTPAQAGPEACRELPADVAASIRALLPDGWALGEASMDLMPVLAEAGAQRGRQLRMWPEATDPRIGWSLDHAAVREVLGCVGAS